MSSGQYIYDWEDGDSIKVDVKAMEITIYKRENTSSIRDTLHLDVRRLPGGKWEHAVTSQYYNHVKWQALGGKAEESCEKAYNRWLHDQIGEDFKPGRGPR